MKITRLLDPEVTGASGGATTVATPAAPVVTAPAVETTTTPSAPVNPGTEAREARNARIAKENADIFEQGEVTPKVEEKPVVQAATIPAQAAAVTPPGLTPQQIAQIAAETAGRMQAKPVEKPQFTQEEIDQQLGIVKVTPEMCIELGLPAEAAPFLDKFGKALVTNSVRMANVIVEQRMAALNQQLAPHITFAQQQQHMVLEHQFREKYPELKGYEPIINDVAAKLKTSGFKGNQQQAFEKIAQGAKEYLKTMNIVPSATTQTSVATAGAVASTSKPNMSTVSAGSQGGAGGAPKAQSNGKDSWKEIFE